MPADSAATSIMVRRAHAGDVTSVWPLVQELAASFTPEPVAFRAAFTELVARDDTLLGVATVTDDVVGYVLASRHTTLFANGPVAWVEELVVHPDGRRQGVGRALMRAAEQWAQDGDSVYLALATRRASDFYDALGYERSATFYRALLPRA
jgi:GNAT superfamily N-acetyltransferase